VAWKMIEKKKHGTMVRCLKQVTPQDEKDMAMRVQWIRVMGILAWLTVSVGTTQANDIVDFFRAVSRSSGPTHQTSRPVIRPVGHYGGDDHRGHDQRGYDHGAPAGISRGHGGGMHGSERMSSRDAYKYQTQVRDRDGSFRDSRSRFEGGHQNHHVRPDSVDLRHPGYGRSDFRPAVGSSRSGVQLSFRVGTGVGSRHAYGQPVYGQPFYMPGQDPSVVLPPVQSYPAAPRFPSVDAYPHQIGEIVDCHVPLATCVRVEDECNIAPHAVPIVVAVRDPQSCHRGCQERVSFVQIFVPPCPPREIRVSPCRTRLRMDFGQYEVDIKSGNGMIVVDYDN
jgi:hypothetical protein